MNEMTEIVTFSQATAAPAAASAASAPSAAPSAAGYVGASDTSPSGSTEATALWSSVGASKRWFVNSYDYYS